MNMKLNEQQYQRIAKFLDGEPIELTPQEQAVVQDIRTGMETLGVLERLQPSSGAMAMARRRMAGQVARGRHRGLRIASFAAAVAAAAILLVVTALPVGVTTPEPLPMAGLSPEQEADIWARTVDYEGMGDIESELAELEADVYSPILAVAVGDEVGSFEHGGDVYWTDELEN